MADPRLSRQSAQKCKRCWHELAPAALVCEQCHALVHAEELDRLAAAARTLEASGKPGKAREFWLSALPLLPPETTQTAWIQEHVLELAREASAAPRPEMENKWASRLAPLGPLAILLTKGKAVLALLKFNFLFSLFAFMGVYWSLYGFRFGIGFAVLILLHEMGHYVDVKRRGLPVDMPVFLPGLGAYVRWQALGVTGETRAAVSLAGPFAGWLSAVACALLWWVTGDGVWAALARAGAWLNVLNLIPVWALDGGQAATVLSKVERLVILTVSLAMWLVVKESVFVLVAAGAGYRLLTRDVPAHPSRVTTAYFALILVLLAAVMGLTPGHGFGNP